jgi:hypothetical protein
MAGPVTRVEYVSDDGNSYRVKMDASNATAAGNEPATSTVRLPTGYRPRYVLATHPTTGRQRKIVVCDPGVALWTGSVATISIEEFSGTHSTAMAHAVYSRVGERRLNL